MPAAPRTLRPAQQGDLDTLVELGRRSWLSAFAQTAPFTLIEWWARTDRVRTLFAANWPQMLLCCQADEILGLVQPAQDEVNGLWVHPAHQGAGVGSQLLAAAEAEIAREGNRVAWLTCSAWNPRALAFYAARGYVETGRTRCGHASGVEVEEIRMERRLR